MEDPFKQKENLSLEMVIATAADWRFFQALKLEALKGKDAYMFGVTPENKDAKILEEQLRGERGWKRRLSGHDAFGILAWNESKPIGMSLAEYRAKEDDWYIYSGYVQEDFRGGVGKKLFAKRLEEIIKRGGKTVTVAVKSKNKISIAIAESFGFKKTEKDSSQEGFYMELDDVNKPEVILKINEVLEAPKKVSNER